MVPAPKRMLVSPEDAEEALAEEDAPLSVPPEGDPDGDRPTVHEADEIEAFPASFGPESAPPPAFDEALPSTPPAWDDESEVGSHGEPDAELLASFAASEDDAPFASEDDTDDIELPPAMTPEDLLDAPFDPPEADDA